VTIENLYARPARYFRTRRMGAFAKKFRLTERTNVLDVGGSPAIWSYLPFTPQVTFVNLNRDVLAGVRGAVADGCRLPFRDGGFDLVFSNSVIEHVGDWDAQRRFAAECRRVGQRYYIQTPDWWFPIEPHLLTPFVHWLPAPARRGLVPFALRAFVDAGVRERRAEYGRIVLLTARQMRTLFPEAQIFRERFCGLSKSLIAIKV